LNRFRRVRFHVVLIPVVVLVIGWLFLYLDSVYQRKKAEQFISDLRSFPFATAGFGEVHDLVERHHGTSSQQFPIWHVPQLALPDTEPQGRIQMPPVEDKPTCTLQDCTFEIWIQPRVLNIQMNYRAGKLLRSVLAYSGIRPWVIYTKFEVRDGELKESRTSVGQLKRNARPDGPYTGLVPLEYRVVTTVLSPYNRDYAVGPSANNLSPRDFLSAWLEQAVNAPTHRAFDIDLRCVTGVWHSCNGFSELAPSAWADYEAQLSSLNKNEQTNSK
jgi:hypothetical protein